MAAGMNVLDQAKALVDAFIALEAYGDSAHQWSSELSDIFQEDPPLPPPSV